MQRRPMLTPKALLTLTVFISLKFGFAQQGANGIHRGFALFPAPSPTLGRRALGLWGLQVAGFMHIYYIYINTHPLVNFTRSMGA